MNWLFRLFLLVLAGAVLLVFLAFAAVMLLLSCLRWLVTGKKPDIVVMINAVQRFKKMAAQQQRSAYHQDDVIEAEVREVNREHSGLPR
jgi:hypothetical protein